MGVARVMGRLRGWMLGLMRRGLGWVGVQADVAKVEVQVDEVRFGLVVVGLCCLNVASADVRLMWRLRG